MDRMPRRSPAQIATGTFSLVICVYLAWIGAWLLKETLDQHAVWLVSSGGAFVYWSTMKLLLWIVPSIALMRYAGRPVRAVFRIERLRPVMAWGLGSGLVLGGISLATKAVMGRPLLALHLSWPQFSVLVIAPVFEEFMFRGAVLGNLLRRYRFLVADTLTAGLFLGLHLPGWYFQGNLRANLTSPVGGAVAIFLLGWVFGLVAHKSRSVVAAMLTHSLNNLFS